MATVVNHVGHCVRDLEQTQRFYEEVLGFEFWRQLLDLEAPLDTELVYLRNGSFVIELLHYRAGTTRESAMARAMNETGLTHLSISVDDIDAVVAKALAYGGSVLEQTHVGVAVMLRDPDGQLIELLTMAYHDNLPD